LVTARSAKAPTAVIATASLLVRKVSVVLLKTSAVLVMVAPSKVLGLTFTTSVKLAL